MDKYTHMADPELVSLYENGDDRAFDVLLERNQERLYSYISYLTSAGDNMEDIFQETFMRAIVAIRNHRYAENGNFISWLYRIAHNVVLDSIRDCDQLNIVHHQLVDENGDLWRGINERTDLAQDNIETLMIQAQQITDLHLLISALPECQRQVISMHYFQEMPFKDIARATGVSINTALGRARYAVLNLRRQAAIRNLFRAS